MAKEREVSIIVDAQNKAGRAFLEVKRGLEDMGQSAKKGTGTILDYMGRADNAVYKFSDRLKFLDTLAKRTFQGAAGASAIYIASTLRDFSQLEDGLSKVNTMYDQTASSQKKMMQDSLNMFRLMPTDFQKITQGMYDSISAGADPRYASMVSRKFGMGAVAGITDIPVVTQAAMGTMNAFGKEIKDLDHILDVQFMTVKAGIVEYEQLASALGTGVLKSAESAGIGMEELYAAIAQITKNAIPANIATTSLVQLFNKFTDTKAIKEFKEFGVSIRNAKGETRPLVEIMKDLNEQFDKRGMNKEARASYLKQILGSDEAVRALQPLLGGLKDFDKILQDMTGSSGAMMDAFDDRLNNLNTQIKLMWNNFKAAGVEQIYTLKPFLDALTEPMIKRQKLQLQKMNLEDYLTMEKDPAKRKMTRQEISDIEKQISEIDLTPVEKFRDALGQSVKELDKINPPLAKFLDTVGNFALNFVGEEGADNREMAGNVGKGIVTIYALKKAVDAVAWLNKNFGGLFGKKDNTTSEPGDSLVETIKTMNVNANVVNVYGKVVNNGGRFPSGGGGGLPPIIPTPLSLPGPSAPMPTLPGPAATGGLLTEAAKKGAVNMLPVYGAETMTAFLSGLPILGLAGIQLFRAYKENHASEELMNNFGNYTFSPTKNKFITKEEHAALVEEQYKSDREKNVSLVYREDNDFKKSASDGLLRIFNIKDYIDRSANMQSQIQVEAPKVNVSVAVDGKNIPSKVSIDYTEVGRTVDRHQYRQSIRHGRGIR